MLAEDIGLYVNTEHLIDFGIALIFHVELICFKLKLFCYKGRAAGSDELDPNYPRGIWSSRQRKSFLIWVLIMVLSLWLCWEWSALWHQCTLIMKCLDQLLCRWDWTWVPCCPYAVPWGLPWENTWSRSSHQHLHYRLLARSWKTLVMLASRRRKIWRMTDPWTKYYFYFLLFFCSMWNPCMYRAQNSIKSMCQHSLLLL